ncbi:hydrogenase expression/formation protein HypE [Streptomyces sp. SID8352]|uniref:hydrogenase expression/formation protein HypE n=1 Tax=Streptomyces sp. SID8352 TaxID=2690338 RepID=UPI00136910B6|nr:hydrogenase expression/formation protein HypE [Streptomyces sp. SID8352]MYU24717.1 hydrogenase expression/formation protein HypE [Streptomyces sp. SID8352]
MSSSAAGLGEVVLDHGSGTQLSHELLSLIVETLGDVYIGEMEDSAMLPITGGRIAMTTDSFVVDPPFFGNGDIGKIAVCGTVNDLAVVGSKPLYLTLGMILETGLPIARLLRVLTSIRETAREAGVRIVCGDTKVVRKGEADQIYLNTAGVGVFERTPLRMTNVRPGDRVVLSGPIGNHTVHLLSIREGLGFDQRVLSDCAPVNGMLDQLFAAVGEGDVHSVRDVTRGGLAAVLQEYSEATGHTIRMEQRALPVQFETVMAMDMLGINPIHSANEGCVCLFVDPSAERAVLDSLRSHRYGTGAVTIGEVTDRPEAQVLLRDADGRDTVVEELRGAELPRLC